MAACMLQCCADTHALCKPSGNGVGWMYITSQCWLDVEYVHVSIIMMHDAAVLHLTMSKHATGTWPSIHKGFA